MRADICERIVFNTQACTSDEVQAVSLFGADQLHVTCREDGFPAGQITKDYFC